MKKSLLLIALLAGAAHAEPTKEETWDYIYKNLRFSYKSDLVSDLYSYSFNKSTCTLQTVVKILEKDGSVYATWTYTIDLADLDPNEVRAYEGSATLNCRERKKCVHRVNKVTGKPPEIDNIDQHTDIYTDVPKRVAKAFAHLIRLCGGKPELF